MFRDPTKFYILVALSYSVLIPFGINSIYRWINAKLKVQSAKLLASLEFWRSGQFKVKSYIPNLFLIFTILYLIFLIRPAIFGELSGTFKPQPVPREYILLKNFIVRQEDSFNTLWIPRVQRYGFDSKRYQAISADRLLGASSIPAVLKEFQEPGIEQTIKNLDIKYIIVPFDSQKDIFLKDRKYDPHLYNSTVAVLQKLVWIEKDNSFGNIIVFRVL